MPTDAQRRPVLSIDLGASYTKVAWRAEWTEGEQVFLTPTKVVKVDGEVLVPSIAIEGGDGTWYFGKAAAGMTPATDGKLHRNWKAELFAPKATKRELKIALQVAERFLAWLRSELGRQFPVEGAVTRLCVPAFAESDVGCQRLLEAMQRAGWTEGEAILKETEPRANLVGLASGGMNHAYENDDMPGVNVREIYHQGPRLGEIAFNTAHGAPPRRFCTIDIGAFTTDISVCDVGMDVKLIEQRSIKHGVALLDARVEELMEERGADPQDVRPADFEQLKRFIYEGTRCRLSIGTRKMEFEEGCMDGEMERFANKIVEQVREYEGVHNLILTGGGSCIPTIARRIREELGYFVVNPGFEETNHERAATALGGASVIIDFYHLGEEEGPSIPPREPRPGDCSCGGWNKNCMRCGGTGLASEEEEEAGKKCGEGPMYPAGDPRTKYEEQVESESVAEEPQQQPDRPATAGPSRVLVSPRGPESSRQRPPESRENETPESAPSPLPPKARAVSKPVTVEDIVQCWQGRECEAQGEFCLDGWMGRLVFDGSLSAEQQRKRLLAAGHAEGQAVWCKLLCLCTSLGVRAHPRVVRKFWEDELKEVWEAFIPRSGKPADTAVLDRFFESKIHRQFSDSNASGEEAELWRRVFYDFRKLHWFVYQNALPEVFLEFLKEPRLKFDALVNFLKTGQVPGRARWAGVLGQSMSAPLLLMLRMLRRVRVIDRPDFDAACYYMNGPVRRVAARLGWMEEGERLWYDMESLVELSQKCHEKVRTHLPEDMKDCFDIPLQWYAEQKRSELRLL